MTPDELKTRSSADGLSLPLQALWLDASGDWDRAHEVCQAASNREGDWVHAYLHRKEGDISNAHYWYARAGRPAPSRATSLEAEWAAIAGSLLADSKI